MKQSINNHINYNKLSNQFMKEQPVYMMSDNTMYQEQPIMKEQPVYMMSGNTMYQEQPSIYCPGNTMYQKQSGIYCPGNTVYQEQPSIYCPGNTMYQEQSSMPWALGNTVYPAPFPSRYSVPMQQELLTESGMLAKRNMPRAQSINVNVPYLSDLKDQLANSLSIVNEMLNVQDEPEELEQSEDNMIKSVHNLEDAVNKLCTFVASLDNKNVGSKKYGIGPQGGVKLI